MEILSYIVLHLLLNRVGRKGPYFIAVLCFAIIAMLTIPVQHFMVKNSRGNATSTLLAHPIPLLVEQRIVTFVINLLLKFLAAGSYAIIYIYANEMFPTGIRNTSMGICSMVARKKSGCEIAFILRCLGIGAIVGTTSNDMLVSRRSKARPRCARRCNISDSYMDQSPDSVVWCLVVGGGISGSDSSRNTEQSIASDHRRH